MLFSDHGIEKMFKLGLTGPNWTNSTRIYLIPAVYSVVENISQQLKDNKTVPSEYHVVVVPKLLNLIYSLFESLGVVDLVKLYSFSWDFIPLDTNLISLEMTDFFKSTLLLGDQQLLGSIAKALLSFECLFGKIPLVVTLGKISSTVRNLQETWHREVQPNLPEKSEFSHLIVIDRDIDLVSVLLTQLTYEGVLDENFRMQCGFVTFTPETGDQAEESQHERMLVNSSKDKIYEEVLNYLI